MTRTVLSCLAAAMLVAVGGSFHAVGADWTTDAHKGVSVTLSEGAGKCGIRSKDEFAKQLQDSLAKVGRRVDPSEPVVARLTVSAKSIGSLKGQCVTVVTLAFVIPMEMDFIKITEKVTNREAMVTVLEKAREFPIVLYEDSDFTAAWPTDTHSEALYLVDQLAQRFAERR